jgi:hypothetical protein
MKPREGQGMVKFKHIPRVSEKSMGVQGRNHSNYRTKSREYFITNTKCWQWGQGGGGAGVCHFDKDLET